METTYEVTDEQKVQAWVAAREAVDSAIDFFQEKPLICLAYEAKIDVDNLRRQLRESTDEESRTVVQQLSTIAATWRYLLASAGHQLPK